MGHYKIIKFLALAIIALLFSFTNTKGKEAHTFIGSMITCKYESINGRLEGNYTSYYKNGKIKAKGMFQHNTRIGTWTIWDSLGNIKTQRIYSNLYTFKRTLPKIQQNKLIELLNVPIYKLTYNKDNYIDYFQLAERAVYHENRVERLLLKKNNEFLFSSNNLINLIKKYASIDSIKLYSDDEFINEIKYEKIDTTNENIIGYKIKEDDFFDIDRFVSEKRILGICPIVFNKKQNKNIDLYWIYFPSIRKYLAKENLSLKNKPPYIKSLDDMFFYRYFASTIKKEHVMFNPIIVSNTEEVELKNIEKEHDLWLEFVN